MGKTVYIASPYTKGSQARNVRQSIEVAERLVERGYIPFVPLLSHFWELMSPHDYDYWMDMDFEWVVRCDALLRLPGESKGADLEVQCAKERGIPVFFSLKGLFDR